MLKKMMPELKPGERLDDLIIQGMRVIQHQQQFCFSLDAILLANFATVKSRALCSDLGTGTGVIAFLLAARGAAKVDGFEINSVMADMARRSAALNQLAESVSIHTMDLRKIKGHFPAGSLDLVVSNPPYRPLGKGKISVIDDVAIARHEIAATLADVVCAAKHLLKYRGRFALVHLPERLAEILVAMHDAGIEPKRLRLVQASADKSPSMVLVEGVVGASPGLEVEAPLFVYRENGDYAQAILDYYPEDKRRT